MSKILIKQKKRSYKQIFIPFFLILSSIHCDLDESDDYYFEKMLILNKTKTKILETITHRVKPTGENKKLLRITAFEIKGVKGKITNQNITLSMPYGTDVKNLKANVQLSKGANISPDPAKEIDYTDTVNFTVTAENGTTKKVYKVTLTVEPNPFLSWTAGWRNHSAFTANISGNNIIIDVDSADFETKVNLTPGTTIDPDPATVTDWTKKVSFKIKKGQKIETFKVKVTVNGKDILKVNNANIKATVENEITKYGNTGNFNHIDVSGVTSMLELFMMKTAFNGNITKWDTSQVKNMALMFGSATAFNQDIGSWKTSNVTTMESMFNSAEIFNKDISRWDVSNVTNMGSMFSGATVFNQNISGWKTPNVTTMEGMFSGAIAFNQNISRWTVSNVTNMGSMFSGATAFNQNISGWDISNVTDMMSMFKNATAFNQNISGWTVNHVTNCGNIFIGAAAFQVANRPTFTGCTP